MLIKFGSMSLSQFDYQTGVCTVKCWYWFLRNTEGEIMISASMVSGVPWTASIIPQGKLLIRGEAFDKMEVPDLCWKRSAEAKRDKCQCLPCYDRYSDQPVTMIYCPSVIFLSYIALN